MNKRLIFLFFIIFFTIVYFKYTNLNGISIAQSNQDEYKISGNLYVYECKSVPDSENASVDCNYKSRRSIIRGSRRKPTMPCSAMCHIFLPRDFGGKITIKSKRLSSEGSSGSSFRIITSKDSFLLGTYENRSLRFLLRRIDEFPNTSGPIYADTNLRISEPNSTINPEKSLTEIPLNGIDNQ